MRTPQIIAIAKSFLVALAITSASAAYAATLKPVPQDGHTSATTEVAFSVAEDSAAL